MNAKRCHTYVRAFISAYARARSRSLEHTSIISREMCSQNIYEHIISTRSMNIYIYMWLAFVVMENEKMHRTLLMVLLSLASQMMGSMCCDCQMTHMSRHHTARSNCG